MTAGTHKLGGFCFGLIIIAFGLYLPMVPLAIFSLYTPVFLTGCIIGGLIPDLDTPNSFISRRLWMIAWPIWLTQKILRKIFGKKKTKFAKNVCSTVGHRGIAHWMSIALVYLAITIIIAVILIVIENNISFENEIYRFSTIIVLYFAYGLTIGNISHIVLDSFNDKGIPLFAPFSFKRISFGNVVTGRKAGYKGIKKYFTTSSSENIFRLILFFICVLLIIYILKLY